MIAFGEAINPERVEIAQPPRDWLRQLLAIAGGTIDSACRRSPDYILIEAAMAVAQASTSKILSHTVYAEHDAVYVQDRIRASALSAAKADVGIGQRNDVVRPRRVFATGSFTADCDD
jgi:hypothetical protein